MALTVYGSRISPFVRKVRVFLAEKGTEYAFDEVNPFAPPDGWRELSPLGRIPVLRDSEVGAEGAAGTLPDSSVICAYLERRLPEPRLYPEDDFACARALWFEEYADSDLCAHIAGGVFQPRVLWKMMKKGTDEARVAKALSETLPPFFDYLEQQLQGQEALVGGSVTIADIAVATQFVNLSHAGEKPDPERWPSLAAFLDRMHARPSFDACIRSERELFGRFFHDAA